VGVGVLAMQRPNLVARLAFGLSRDGTSINDAHIGFLWSGDDGATGCSELSGQHLNLAPVQTTADAIEVDVHTM
jgi:hypothetical protein